MNDDQAFWMVWNPAGSSPTVRHEHEERAIREAERLARAHPGQTFYVMLATESRMVNDMQRVRLMAELPF